MDGQHILSNGVDTLYIVREKLEELNENKSRTKELDEREDRLENEIEVKEKAIQEEINVTVRKRREAVNKTYDDQLNLTKQRIKKITNKKEKLKSAKVSERINIETAEYSEKIKSIKNELKTLLKQNNLPSICRLRIFYSFYAPYSIKDFINILTVFLFIYFLIPCGIFYFFVPEHKIFSFVLIYVITILLSFIVYFLINRITKSAHREAIMLGRTLRIDILKNEKKIKRIKKKITRDKDESGYDLDHYNEEIQSLEMEIEEIGKQKIEALKEFEHQTSSVIEQEIRSHYEKELNLLKTEHNRLHEESAKSEHQVKNLSMLISKEYEALLGSEFLIPDRLNQLIQLMEENQISTVSEAILMYQKNNN